MEPWWEALPDTLADLTHRWEVTLDEPVGRGNTSLVLRCRRTDGAAAILKLVPDNDIVRAEAHALRSWSASHRVPEVWEDDPSAGAILLEAIPNEIPISETTSSVSLGDIADLIRSLHRTGTPEVGRGIVSLSDRVEFMFGHWQATSGQDSQVTRVVPVERVQRGYDLARTLAAEADQPVLLHGDLHASNVLDGGAQRGLIAIDPRPCVGDATFDGVDWVFWPIDDPHNWQPRCTSLASELGHDAERLWEWCRTFAAMLAATTALREGQTDRFDAFIALAP
jgi:streptomycin 6-kinase